MQKELRIHPTGDMYEVSETFYFRVQEPDRLRHLVLPAGFKTDGASIHRFLWTILGSPFNPKVIKAATIHDFLIRQSYNPEIRDKLFYDTLIDEDNSKLKSKILYYGVVGYRKLKLYYVYRWYKKLIK